MLTRSKYVDYIVWVLFCYNQSIFFYSMSNTPYKHIFPRGQPLSNHLARKDIRTSSTVLNPHSPRPKHVQVKATRVSHPQASITRPNHSLAAVSRTNLLSDVSNRSYPRYSRTHSSTSLKLPKIPEKSESKTVVPAHRSSKVSLASECSFLPDNINSHDRRDVVSPWDTLGKSHNKNGTELFSIREFLEQCSPNTEEISRENSSHWDTSLNGSFPKGSNKGMWCFPKMLFWKGHDAITIQTKPSIIIFTT